MWGQNERGRLLSPAWTYVHVGSVYLALPSVSLSLMSMPAQQAPTGRLPEARSGIILHLFTYCRTSLPCCHAQNFKIQVDAAFSNQSTASSHIRNATAFPDFSRYIYGARFFSIGPNLIYHNRGPVSTIGFNRRIENLTRQPLVGWFYYSTAA